MADTLRSLAKAGSSCNWSQFVIWHSATHLEGKDVPLSYGGNHNGEYTSEDLVYHIEICRREKARLEALKRDDSIICDLILSCRAIELMNRLVLCINNAEGYTDKNALQADFDQWLSDYSSAWLRDDKPSDLWRLQEFVQNITK